MLLRSSFVNGSSPSLLYFCWLRRHSFWNWCSDFCNSFDGSFGSWNDVRLFDFEIVVVHIVVCYGGCFLHLKCTFDSSISVIMMMRMKLFITIAIVMMTKFMNRSHNSCRDVNDDNIHNVRNLFRSMLMTLLLFVNFVEANFWFKRDCDWYWCTVLCFFHIEFCRTEFALYSILFDFDTRYLFWTEFLI